MESETLKHYITWICRACLAGRECEHPQCVRSARPDMSSFSRALETGIYAIPVTRELACVLEREYIDRAQVNGVDVLRVDLVLKYFQSKSADPQRNE